MDYVEVKFTATPDNEAVNDVLSAILAEIGFESFVETPDGVTAYIQATAFDEDELKATLAAFPLETTLSYTAQTIEGKDWNEEWEKNYFKPLIIDNRCIIQSTFHKEPAVYEYNILIDPKMAFGTGHHQTTELMIREILDTDYTGKTVLDMGCGTAILAILASMRGAKSVLGIDIDKWAYDNAIENLNLNNISNVEIQIGGADLLGADTFDVILANINRNILLNDIHRYAAVLNRGGALYMSGFYEEDIPLIAEECGKYNLTLNRKAIKDNWAVVRFDKD
ncbi:ribosomal protein L11 methyltransferase [Dysgonomonas sp. PH5-45]|uniref:50S ribosomal protein L11 methyltransferase n=1 Tax=unclassified Dysgonomonas TaxID=2630389 RepID=UPI0024732336|nr:MULTISPECIES: 50S ribosomal protein L11 methyltransferase [unclassified Dysgonomonas]MDH6356046.1 ribosomal protein L11 methyltransferase [Dysgonomonas sp. PH5-45]MDH6388939.1 ribosomal protein L11 methyltransferase [Dysgonomonas sp. PH5-37]